MKSRNNKTATKGGDKMHHKKINTKPFDSHRTPPRQNLFFMLPIWLLCWLLTRSGRLKIHKSRMKGLKPPFLVFGTHHAFMDFYVTPLALFPYRANYVSELEGFENFGEWLYRQAGCLGTRKFINDLALVRNIKRVIARKDILVLFPEARYTNAGTSSQLPHTVGKLAKILEVPVVTINMHGNYLQSPIWNLKRRKGVRLEAEITQLFTKEELKQASAAEVQAQVQAALTYDEYEWQYQKNMKIDDPKRVEGLELVLYQCLQCGTEFRIMANGADLSCKNCGCSWHMTELGKLKPLQGAEPKFLHIPDWYEWQRRQVIAEIDSGAYQLQTFVEVQSLPNAKNFIDLGKGFLVHDRSGFSLTFTEYGDSEEKTLHFSAISTQSIHTEYDYRNKGQCITLSITDNTYFLYPLEEGFNVTKIQFATEYFYDLARSSES